MKKGVIVSIFLLLLISFEYGNLAQGQGDKGSFAVEEGNKFTYNVDLLTEAMDSDGDGSTNAMKDPDSNVLVTQGDKLELEITSASAESVTTKMIYANDETYEEVFTKDANKLGDRVLTTGWEYWKVAADAMKIPFPDMIVTDDSNTFGIDYTMSIPMAGMDLNIIVIYDKGKGIFEELHNKMTYSNNDSLIWEMKIVKTENGDGLIPGFTVTSLIFIVLVAIPIISISRRR